MARKRRARRETGEAAEVFRQFAWNLAGTLARRPEKAAERKPENGR